MVRYVCTMEFQVANEISRTEMAKDPKHFMKRPTEEEHMIQSCGCVCRDSWGEISKCRFKTSEEGPLPG